MQAAKSRGAPCDVPNGEQYCGDACRAEESEDVENRVLMRPSGMSAHVSAVSAADLAD